jgi:hypothetical protein
MAADRADFLSHLFSRPRPAKLGKDSTVTDLFDAYRDAEMDEQLYEGTLASVENHLIKDHGFELSTDDQTVLSYIMKAFAIGGTSLGYPGPQRSTSPRILPTYEELMVDIDDDGRQQSYLATEENFVTLQQFERNNLLVPIVGDFAGPSAIRAVGDYLKSHNTTVSALYTSNVEQYLFMNDVWKSFYKNVATLPLDEKSVFIRPLINTGPGGYAASPLFRPGFHWDTLLFPIRNLITAFDEGMIENYYDVIAVHN